MAKMNVLINPVKRVCILASHKVIEYGLTGAPQLVDAIKEALEPLLQI